MAIKFAADAESAATASEVRTVTILGSTGSIGCSTVDLLERNRELYQVEALVAGRNTVKLAEQARSLQPKMVVLSEEAGYQELKEALSGSGIEVAAGQDAVLEAAERPAEWVMASIVGAAGLEPTLRAIRRGVTVALANKECLVCAGALMMEEVKAHGATLLPVDSEHNAIFQVFETERRDAIERIILTASGGPFRQSTKADMEKATPEQAVAHPNWSMGAKISVDSASMMNKGLELIEAAYLFDMPEDKIEVVVHPQSIIHSMVGYSDGSVLAQLGSPDMRTPIGYSLAWPERMHTPAQRLDFASIAQLTFEKPDLDRFPALRLARECFTEGGSAPVILNAANEIAVQAFLDRKIGFLDIAHVVDACLEAIPFHPVTSLEDVKQIDRTARVQATCFIDERFAIATAS